MLLMMMMVVVEVVVVVMVVVVMWLIRRQGSRVALVERRQRRGDTAGPRGVGYSSHDSSLEHHLTTQLIDVVSRVVGA